MMPDNVKSKELKFGIEAREAFLRGVNILADAVQATLGPGGRNVAIDRLGQLPHVTKDGVSVARYITKLENAYEDMGAQLVRSVASKTAEVAGDGTTTATVLARALIKNGLEMEATQSRRNATQVKKGMQRALKEAERVIHVLSRPVNSVDDIRDIATISSNGDRSIGAMMAEAFADAGMNGLVTIEEGHETQDSLRATGGFRYLEGYGMNTYFVNDPRHMKVELENPYILICSEHIRGGKEIEALLRKIAEEGRSVLIIANTFDQSVINMLATNAMNGALKVGITRFPVGFKEDNDYLAQDIALITGGSVVSNETGVHLTGPKGIKLDELGVAERVTITRNHTTIIGGKGPKKGIEGKIKQLQDAQEKLQDPRLKKQLGDRVANLLGKISVITVGGATEVEIHERKDRLDDSLAAVISAYKGGIVPGGGVALIRAKKALKSLLVARSKESTLNEDEIEGVKLVLGVLDAPFRQILENIAEDPEHYILKIVSSKKNEGYNALTKEFGNMLEMGIIDPTEVVLEALRNAVSVASMVLMTEVVITDHKEPYDMIAVRQ